MMAPVTLIPGLCDLVLVLPEWLIGPVLSGYARFRKVRFVRGRVLRRCMHTYMSSTEDDKFGARGCQEFPLSWFERRFRTTVHH
jgi:hypothetical protein